MSFIVAVEHDFGGRGGAQTMGGGAFSQGASPPHDEPGTDPLDSEGDFGIVPVNLLVKKTAVKLTVAPGSGKSVEAGAEAAGRCGAGGISQCWQVHIDLTYFCGPA